jgi:hypothetical protein
MERSTPSIWLVAISFVGLLTGCQAGGVGDPCVPEDEYQTTFSGYSVGEVNVESRSFQCETRVCLVNHFQGRVSCPYGMPTQDLADSCKANWSDDCCRIPGTTGENADDRVQLAVSPQLKKRRAEQAVYCSCRCANAEGKTDDGARYCSCPSGYECTQLIDDLKLGGQAQLAGSYCIRAGTKYATSMDKSECLTPPDCGKKQPY